MALETADTVIDFALEVIEMFEDDGHTAEDMLRLFSTPAPKADAALEAQQMIDCGTVYAPARDVRLAIRAILTAEIIAAA